MATKGRHGVFTLCPPSGRRMHRTRHSEAHRGTAIRECDPSLMSLSLSQRSAHCSLDNLCIIVHHWIPVLSMEWAWNICAEWWLHEWNEISEWQAQVSLEKPLVWGSQLYPSEDPFPEVSCVWPELTGQTVLFTILLLGQQGWLCTQFSSVAQSCTTLCDPMDFSTPGLPVHHQLSEFTQTHAHWVSDAIQPSQPLSSPSPSTFNLSQHQGLFQ